MENPKLRKTLITLHLLFAAFLTPAFILVAISGGNYLIGNKGSVQSTAVALPTGTALDFSAKTLDADVRALIKTTGLDHDFEYIKNRGTLIQTRPTSRTYLEIKQTPEGLSASLNKPNLQKSMIELHKGHGPRLFKTYQKVVAIGLIGVVLGGVLVGLLARAYRRRTLIALGVGTIVFFVLALFA